MASARPQEATGAAASIASEAAGLADMTDEELKLYLHAYLPRRGVEAPVRDPGGL
jgi:hypothetical protein